MRSRSPQRNRPPARRHSPRQRSRSSSTPDRKQEPKDSEVRSRNDVRSHRGKGQKESLRKREFGNKHHSRRRKDSSESEREPKGVVQKDGSRKPSKSPDQGMRRPRSKSDDRKRSRNTRHGKKRMKRRSKSEETAKNASRRSRKRSGSGKRSRSPEHKRKARNTDVLEEKPSQMPTRQEGEESFGVRKQTAPKKRSDQTRITLSERFSQFHEGKPIVLDESISIEIERNIDGDEPFVIPNFHPHEVLLPRRNDEGRKPFTGRTEFASRRDEEPEQEYTEKRVVSVMRSHDREKASETIWHRLGRTSRGAGEASSRLPNLFWKDIGHETVIQVPIITSDRTRDAESEVTSASDRLGRRVVQTRRDPEVRRSGGPEPQFRDRRRLPAFREEPNLRQINSQDQEMRFSRGINRRFDPQGRRRPMDNFRGKVTSSVSLGAKLNLREEEKDEPEELPDFSRRPDKYSYDSWMDKPEMIPRGRSYFEHDNRSEDVPWEVNRGRGRGSFVRGGRGGRGRGFVVGRGVPRFQNAGFQNAGFRNRSRSTEPLEWKHDKFEALEDEKPSSTTEK